VNSKAEGIVIQHSVLKLREPFEKFVDWQQYATVMQKEAVTVISSCGGVNIVVA
jgi:hypothetical protein